VALLCLLAGTGAGFAADTGKSDPGNPPKEKSVRSIVFSGLQWDVKASGQDRKLGPGPNYWGGGEDNVRMDQEGRLHLKITKLPGEKGRFRWFCAEVISKKSFGYGEYRWRLDTPVKADPNVVLGLFTWDDDPESDRFHHREIDIELISTWGDASATNAQFCVQPWTTRRNRHRFAQAEAAQPETTHTFSWAKDSVLFRSLRGQNDQPAEAGNLVEEWKCSGSAVPPPGGENVRMNLWLLNPPGEDFNEVEVIIRSFEFVPPPQPAGSTIAVEITETPPPSLRPGPQGTGRIAGRVSGGAPGEYKIVVFAKSDKWYCQPYTASPDTAISDDGRWATRSHGGDEYAAVLATKAYSPPATMTELPRIGGDIVAVATRKADR
jgi:hypothetical protein